MFPTKQFILKCTCQGHVINTKTLMFQQQCQCLQNKWNLIKVIFFLPKKAQKTLITQHYSSMKHQSINIFPIKYKYTYCIKVSQHQITRAYGPPIRNQFLLFHLSSEFSFNKSSLPFNNSRYCFVNVSCLLKF